MSEDEVEMVMDKWESRYRSLIILVRFLVLLFVAYLSYRVAKITGHWEFGMLTFLVTGYVSYLADIRSELKSRGLYNKS
jgi:hypothetical protein